MASNGHKMKKNINSKNSSSELIYEKLRIKDAELCSCGRMLRQFCFYFCFSGRFLLVFFQNIIINITEVKSLGFSKKVSFFLIITAMSLQK